MQKRLEKRLAKCKKHLYNNLIDLLMNNLNLTMKGKHYV